MSKRTLGHVVLLGSAWGLAECLLGVALKACASSISGSVMTAAALFFIAAAWVSDRKAANVVLLVGIAIAFKMFDALLLGLPLRSGAIVHPAYAFVIEGAGFLAVGILLLNRLKTSSRPEIEGTLLPQLMTSLQRRGIWGGGISALIAAAAFPLVKFASGIPACLVPGSSIPAAWAYAPLAVGLSMLAVPLGFKTAYKTKGFASGPIWRIPATIILSLALMAVVRGFISRGAGLGS
jgi:hypothetical protein